MTSLLQQMDESFASSRLGAYFEIKERKSTLSIEIRGAVATFMSMAYILAVNPRILADSGGPCVPDPNDPAGVFGDAYSSCMEGLKRQLITSTAVASMMGCFIMGITANMPIGLAPGMGMNAFFTYSVVGFRGTGDVDWNAALLAVLIEGIIFLVLGLSGARYFLVKLIPEPVRLATPAGIGAFLAHLGLQTAEGVGMVVADTATIVTLGGCALDKRTKLVAFTEACQADVTACIPGDAYTCDVKGGIMRDPTTWLGLIGLVIMLVGLSYKKRSSFVVGIGFVTFISWFCNTAVTFFPDTIDGDARFDYFRQVVAIEGVDKVFAQFGGNFGKAIVALITFIYVDFLDTSGTFLAIAHSINIVRSDDGDFPKSRWAFSADAIATIIGAFLGLSPVTSYIESGAGVAAGSRTGVTAIFVGFFFFLSIFFAPIIASIPPWATGGALIITGALMARSLGQIKWHDITHASTAFLTVLVMPLTYSIAYGLLAGIICYMILHGTFTILEFAGIAKPTFDESDVGVIASLESTTDNASNAKDKDKIDAASSETENEKETRDDADKC